MPIQYRPSMKYVKTYVMGHPEDVTEEVSVCHYFSIKFFFGYCKFLFQELDISFHLSTSALRCDQICTYLRILAIYSLSIIMQFLCCLKGFLSITYCLLFFYKHVDVGVLLNPQWMRHGVGNSFKLCDKWIAPLFPSSCTTARVPTQYVIRPLSHISFIS